MRLSQPGLEAAFQRVVALRWADSLYGRIPADLVGVRLDLRSAPWSALRWSPYMTFMFRPDRLSRFWLREYRLTGLLAVILLNSAAFHRRPQPTAIRDLSQASSLSPSKIAQILDHAEATADIRKIRFVNDKRFLLLEPSPALVAMANSIVEDWLHCMSVTCQRPNPLTATPKSAQISLYKFGITLAASNISNLSAKDRGLDRKSFLFTMWDLLLEGPLPQAEFVLRQAQRLRVTPMTIRNTVDRGREMGWIAPSAPLQATDLAHERISAVVATLEARWHAILDILEHPHGLEALQAWLAQHQA